MEVFSLVKTLDYKIFKTLSPLLDNELSPLVSNFFWTIYQTNYYKIEHLQFW
jgi:hypothetical protein